MPEPTYERRELGGVIWKLTKTMPRAAHHQLTQIEKRTLIAVWKALDHGGYPTHLPKTRMDEQFAMELYDLYRKNFLSRTSRPMNEWVDRWMFAYFLTEKGEEALASYGTGPLIDPP